MLFADPSAMHAAMPPAFLISGARSGCGKTTLSLALMAAFARRGLVVQGFKTGPDFIDTAWHSAATGRTSYNLDPWMHIPQSPLSQALPPPGTSPASSLAHALCCQFLRATSHASPPDLAIMEGAMGLFDGLPHVPASSADVACLLNVPVLLALDCQGCAATAAAVAFGLANFRPHLPVLGAVGTFVGSERHASLVREAFADSPIPLLGTMPRNESLALPSRHLGLFSAAEEMSAARLDALALAAETHLDLDAILALASRFSRSPEVSHPAALPSSLASSLASCSQAPVRVAIARDEAFSFWYAEHDQILADAGVTLIPFSPLRDSGLPPDIHGLILPGGYPELYARTLSANTSMREAVRLFSGIVYGECGGYLYLMESLDCDGTTFPLCGALPLKARMESQRVALGYREATALTGPWSGLTVRGHEFHYSRIIVRPESLPALWRCRAPASGVNGSDFGDTDFYDGAKLGNIFASYLHISFLSQPAAALRFADACRANHLGKQL